MKPSSRASSIPRELACPGSPLVIARVGERAGTEGHEGEWLHYQIALRLVNEFGATAPEGGLTPPKLPANFKIPRTSEWIVGWAIRRIQELVPAGWSLLVEVEMETEFPRWKLTGHADWVAISPDGTQFLAGDWKTGYEGAPRADENDQALSYLCLLKLTWPSLLSGSFYMFQPRLPADDPNYEGDDDEGDARVSWVTLGADELESCVPSLDTRKCAALDNAMRLLSGPQCKWCVGLRCPCLQKELESMELTLTEELLATLTREPNDAEIARLQFSSRTLANPIKDLKKLAGERIKATGGLTDPEGRRITAVTQGAGIKVTDPVNYGRVVRELVPDPDKLAVATRYAIEPLVHLIAEETGAPKGGKSGGSARDILDVRTSPFFEVRTKEIFKYSL